MTFEETKLAILSNARQYGVCEGYWDILHTTDYQSMIDAGIPLLTYAYRSGVLTDALLSEFDETLLNANGIYTTNGTVTNPTLEIWVLKNAEVTVTLDNGEHHNVNAMGTSTVHVLLSNGSYCKLKSYQNAVADITLNDESVGCIDCFQSSAITVTQNNDSVTDIATMGDCQMDITANDTSYALVQGLGESSILTTGTGTINQKLYELSKNPILI